MGPARLGALLDRWSPVEAWARVLAGTVHRDAAVVTQARRLDQGVAARWRSAALAVDVGRLWAAHVASDVTVVARGEAGFPSALAGAEEPEPPAVIFHRGSLTSLDRPRVAIVGTRRCTYAGRTVARELGADLAAAGVCVVSGLALGIDGAAHEGALAPRSAAPVAVVGTGLDIVYPRRHAELWARVAKAGAVLSEYPLSTRPEPWRFPARNRLIAGLADVVVVVESHTRGGSMHTVEAALERGRTVMAVPGPVRSPAAAGTNGLLVAGSAPARDAEDVLVALGLVSEAASRGGEGRSRPGHHPVGPSDARAAVVLDAVGNQAASMSQVAGRLDPSLGLTLGTLAVALAHLEHDGWLVCTGGWYERRDRPA